MKKLFFIFILTFISFSVYSQSSCDFYYHVFAYNSNSVEQDGVEVTLYDLFNATPVDIQLTANGKGALFTNLPIGTYTAYAVSHPTCQWGPLQGQTFNHSCPSQSFVATFLQDEPACDYIGQSKNTYLLQNYPNPFNPVTKINYVISKSDNVKLTIYDALGKEIATLVNGYKDLGEYSVDFDASDLSSGLYIYKMETGSFVDIKKMFLIK